MLRFFPELIKPLSRSIGTLPFMTQLAIRNDDTTQIRQMLHKVNWDLKANLNRSALAFACHQGANEVASLLLDHTKMRIDEGDVDQITPLHAAIRNPNINLETISKMLNVGVQRGIKMNVPDATQRTPLVDAVLGGRADVVHLLLNIDEFKNDQKTGETLILNGLTIFYLAKNTNNQDLVKHLLTFTEITSLEEFRLLRDTTSMRRREMRDWS